MIAEDLASRIVDIKGWYEPSNLTIVQFLNEWHQARGIVGSVVEIGVYCGRSFVGLASCCRPEAGERAVAIDVFDRQDWNESQSGAGHVEDIGFYFDKTVREFGLEGVTTKLLGRSCQVTPEMIFEACGNRPRMFRVDGGHSYAETLYDLKLAAGCLEKNGFVFIDDVFSPSWPEVSAALSAVLLDGTLSPFFIWGKEVVLVRPQDYDYCKSSWRGIPKHYTRKWVSEETAIYQSQ